MLILLLGGVRSGKSRRALEIAGGFPHVTYVATAQPSDDEMAHRIERHRRERPDHWETLEADADLPRILHEHGRGADHLFILDCLTIYVARLMESDRDQPAIEEHIREALLAASEMDDGLVIVSNEVGMGVVPPYPEGRRYRDILGCCNQLVAQAADEVHLMVAGLATRIK